MNRKLIKLLFVDNNIVSLTDTACNVKMTMY